MEPNELILTVGLPRSGKSTWAIAQGLPVVNPDAIRLALHGQAFLKDAEEMVWAIAMYMVKALFLAGHGKVILDATNTTKARRDKWINPSLWDVSLKVFRTSPTTCIERAKDCGREDLIPIIQGMNEKADFWNLMENEGDAFIYRYCG
jgi:predicted kinase